MTDDRKKQLFPYFAYQYSMQLNPEKYGKANGFEEWSQLLEESPEDADKIITAASELSDAQWTSLEEQYNNSVSKGTSLEDDSSLNQDDSEDVETTPTVSAKNGAKLDYLKKLDSYKKGSKMKKKKKCSCGCDLIAVKEEGGKLTEKCACGCGISGPHKHEKGGSISQESLNKISNYRYKRK